MVSLTLKNLPDDLMERLRARAAAERRSVVQQATWLIERGLDAERPGRVHEPSVAYGRLRADATPQVDAWRRLAGQWRSDETAEEEKAALRKARTSGREVTL